MVDTDTTNRISDWIKKQANDFKIAVEVSPGGVIQDGNWFHVRVAVIQNGDAYDRAAWLQRIEDEWDPNAFGGVELLLVPSVPSEPSKSELYNQVSELMERQHVLLDKLGQQSDNHSTADVERFQSIRQEWEETLNEMARIYPSLRNGVI